MLAAHSSVFQAQFFGECVEAASSVVTVTEFSFNAFELFLSLVRDTSSDGAYRVIHSASLEVDLVEVYVIADKYCAITARNIVEGAVLHHVTQQNWRGLFERCKRYRTPELAQRICDRLVARLPKESIVELLKEFVAKFVGGS
eukprot:gnl/MRDRNA2_/MRDRNA2_332918_c0_seq1.p1 gnl/MRDRNA2_/MRDRNA2_332918_c0~~gnl/MRDRNA2_/MRDRNA2_332918_c0_seq1.p1  ORF type:complete len:143 (-),score=25.74 gnl/MRDRNA2_/MRDRNA2_332918_c0_seq1:41-469(-)